MKISLLNYIAAMAIVVVFLPLGANALTDEERDKQIIDIEAEAAELYPGAVPHDEILIDDLVEVHDLVRDEEKEQNTGVPLMDRIWFDYPYHYKGILNQQAAFEPMLFFITYDYGTTKYLGAGERAGSVASWRKAYKRDTDVAGVVVPWDDDHWVDIIKIANGRWPGEILRDADYEQKGAGARFKEIYLRDPDRSNPHDDAAVMTIAYGLRPEPRNLNSEAQAIEFFKGIYYYNPSSARDWDIVRAIAYSGATR